MYMSCLVHGTFVLRLDIKEKNTINDEGILYDYKQYQMINKKIDGAVNVNDFLTRSYPVGPFGYIRFS